MTEPTSTSSSSSSSDAFFAKPILNSPYKRPTRHWELDKSGQPTQHLIENRRRASFVTPIPKPKKHSAKQAELGLDDVGISSSQQAYQNTATVVNEVREQVDRWRREKPSNWNVTPETARLLDHWRNYDFKGVRPFFCQLEAIETIIWLSEVAPTLGKAGKVALDYLERASNDAYPDSTPPTERLMRIALKLATGAGKTTVMAMLIAWQTVNAVRRPNSKRFTKGFLIVAPGLTIKDRLRVLLPNDPDSYYSTRELVPQDMLLDMQKAKLVITNFHAFRLRERIELSKGGRSLLQGRGEELDTLETEGQMIQRVMPDLMGMKDIMVLNDEAHHCYREKPSEGGEHGEDVDALDADDKKEAEKNSKAARQWITGLESVKRKLGVSRVIDLSATPFFLSGSGYVEGTLFPWTMSDFSLMDAIECGIVKLPRVPIADNIPGVEMPMYRELWKHIGKKMPKKRRGQGPDADPLDLPVQLQTALEALYGHYKLTYDTWMERGSKVPPCFIVVCNNTTTSKLVYDFISGFHRKLPDGTVLPLQNGRLALFRNFDEHGEPLPRPNTLLIDSEQLESGEALDDQFRGAAADEIALFRQEKVKRDGAGDGNQDLSDQQLLREVMNTVGKEGKLGGSIRCVVSVAMLTEGWDANTVTHVLGVRAFGTQLLCEQVIGRALRRQSYELNDKDLFEPEYADILGIPFDFTAKPVIATPQPPPPSTRIHALPERVALEIRFPRVVGYRVELPATRLEWKFNEDSKLVLKPELVGATETQNSGIIGERVNLNLVHTGDVRPSTVLYELTAHLIQTRWRDENGEPRLNLFGQLKRIARDWLDTQLECVGGTYPAQLVYKTLADLACARITDAITRAHAQTSKIAVTLDPFNPTGSSTHVNYRTSRDTLWNADANKSHVNLVVLDSSWEAELCRVVEAHPRVRAYVKNAGLGFEVPFQFEGELHQYRPDFIVRVEDGHGGADLLNLVVEIKGYRGENAKDKKATMETRWIPGVNHDGRYGRWAFAELGEVYQIESDFKAKVSDRVAELIATVVSPSAAVAGTVVSPSAAVAGAVVSPSAAVAGTVATAAD